MNIFKFVRATALWILLIPPAFYLGGAASNQAVIIANHDTFPVKINEYKLERYRVKLNKAALSEDEDVALTAQLALEALDHGYLDTVHVVMTNNTHLNFLADNFDIDGIYSVGDFSLYLGEYLWMFAPYLWAFEAIRRLAQKK